MLSRRLVQTSLPVALTMALAAACVSTDRPTVFHRGPGDVAAGDAAGDAAGLDAPPPDVSAPEVGPGGSGSPGDLAPPDAAQDVAADVSEGDAAGGGGCSSDDECPAGGPCEVARCDQGECAVASAPDGAPCDDGDEHTVADVCLGGGCAGFRESADTSSCGSPLTHTYLNAVMASSTDWSFSKTTADAAQQSPESALWTMPLGQVQPTASSAAPTAPGDPFIGVRAGFAVTRQGEVFAYTPAATGTGGAPSWAHDGGAWSGSLKGALSATPACTARAMWANRRGPGGARLYVVGISPDGVARLIACHELGSGTSSTCFVSTLSGPGEGGAVSAALDGVPTPQGERVFAVINRPNTASGGDGGGGYASTLWVADQDATSWTLVPFAPGSLQNAEHDPAQAVVALSPERALLLEGHGTVIEVRKDPVQISWHVENLTSTHSALATWSGSETDLPSAPVTYVAGLRTPTALLLVGQGQPLGAGSERGVLLRWIPWAPIGGSTGGPTDGEDPPAPGLPDWNAISTVELGAVGVPLSDESPFGDPSGVPRVGIYDAALALAPTGDALLPPPLMLVGAVRGEDACAQWARFVRVPPGP